VSARGGDWPDKLFHIYCSGAQAYIICFSLNSTSSLQSTSKFANAITKFGGKSCLVVLVGMAFCGERQVTRADGATYAAALGAQYVEVGGRNQIIEMFADLATSYVQARESLAAELWYCLALPSTTVITGFCLITSDTGVRTVITDQSL
jgi:hypothetical protein